MMRALWPQAKEYDFPDEVVFVWERDDGRLGGIASVSVREWVEGCTSEPVPNIEGWWIDSDLQRKVVGRALLAAIEDWARNQGFMELGSDAEQENAGSIATHVGLGFEPTDRLQSFRKQLR